MMLQWLGTRWMYIQLQTVVVNSGVSSFNRRRSLCTILTAKQLRWAILAVFGLIAWAAVLYSSDQIAVIWSTSSSTAQHDVQNDVQHDVHHEAPHYADSIDWSRFAYVQYVTDKHYLCNSVMFFERLQHLQSKADRVMMYPADMLLNPYSVEGVTNDAKLLILARDKYGVNLVPVAIQHRHSSDPTWAKSYTKLLAFNQTRYDRVISIDSDSTVLQHMDELFSLPPTPVAMPRAYWLYPDQQILSSQIMLVQPSEVEFSRVKAKISDAGRHEYDMEILNQLYKDSCLILPHRPYDLLTGEFRKDHHESYLGNSKEIWDPIAVYNEAKLLHFSDWPLHKPWLDSPQQLVRDVEPKCVMKDGVEDCAAKEIWHGIYKDFKDRRRRVCDIG